MKENLSADVRLALRAVRTQPRFALLVIALYAIGVGSNTAVFSVVDDVLLDPLAFADADRLVTIWERHPQRGLEDVPAAPARMLEWRDRGDLFAGVSSYAAYAMDYRSPEGPDRLMVGATSAGFFRVLGVEALIGRTFYDDEHGRGGEHVVLLTHPFWSARFGRAADVLGRTLTLEGEPHEVIGVLPPGAALPGDVDVVRPLVVDNPTSRAAHGHRVVARLADGVTLERAHAELSALAERNSVERAETDAGWSVAMRSLRDQIVGDLDRSLLLFQGAVAFVLLIASANVASLLLMRSAQREREIALRVSLGAGRARIVAQVLTESVVLALLGGAGGVAVARVAGAGLRTLSPIDMPGGSDSGLDITVWAFASALSLGCGVVFGALPAIRATGRDPMRAIRESGGTPSRERAALRRAIVAGQIGVATLLLLGAGLFLRSLDALTSVDPGFRSSGVLVGEVRPPFDRYGSSLARSDLYDRLVAALRHEPGVRAAGAVSHIPMGGTGEAFRFTILGRETPTFADLDVAEIRSVSDGYFDVVGLALVEGRVINATDLRDTQPVAVVNRSMARRFWEGRPVLGEAFSLSGPDGPWIRIVGVVEDVRHFGLALAARPEMYVPMTQEPWPAMSLVAGVAGDPTDHAGALRDAVARVDPLLAVTDVQPLQALVDGSAAPWRFQALVVTAFGTVAGVLAAVGIYGLLGFLVQERVVELAVRRALGASTSDVRRLVGREVVILAVFGVAAGLVAGGVLSRLIGGLLFGVSPLDPASYLGAGALLGLVSVIAAWVPARRASRVDPAVALRGS